MAANHYYYYLLKNQDISGAISEFELPNGDAAQLISGFINDTNIDEQTLLQTNNVIKYRNIVVLH
jgi:hypothetical protein